MGEPLLDTRCVKKVSARQNPIGCWVGVAHANAADRGTDVAPRGLGQHLQLMFGRFQKSVNQARTGHTLLAQHPVDEVGLAAVLVPQTQLQVLAQDVAHLVRVVSSICRNSNILILSSYAHTVLHKTYL